MNLSVSEAKNTSVAPASGTEQNNEKIIASLTKRWTRTRTSTVANVFDAAKIISDAHDKLETWQYHAWLRDVCKINHPDASKYCTINDAAQVEVFTSKKDLLPLGYTAVYHLATIFSEKNLNAASEETFNEALDYCNTRANQLDNKGLYPNTEAIRVKVAELLGKSARKSKGTLADEVNKQIDAAKAEADAAKAEADAAKAEADAAKAETAEAMAQVAELIAQAGVPDALTGATVTRMASDPLGDEPTPEEIAEAMEPYEDHNEVEFAAFMQKYQTLMIAKEIKATLRKFGVNGVTVKFEQEAA